MPVKTRKEKKAQKKDEIKAAADAEAKKPKPAPAPPGAELLEDFAAPYMAAAVGTVVGIKRGVPDTEPRLVTYVETEEVLKKLLKARRDALKPKEEK